MSEKLFYNKVKKGLQNYAIYFERIECISLQGVPDVCYFSPFMFGSGWIEFKYLQDWPKRQESIVKVQHFTNHQRNWIVQKGQMSKKVFLFLQVNHHYLLFDWHSVLAINKVPRQRLLNMAILKWKNEINYFDLSSMLVYGSVK